MKRLLFLLVFAVTISGVAVAQDFPRVEIYGGYSADPGRSIHIMPGTNAACSTTKLGSG